MQASGFVGGACGFPTKPLATHAMTGESVTEKKRKGIKSL